MKKGMVFCVYLVVILAVVGCGGQDANQPAVTTISVEMTEFKFNPTNMVVPVGQDITLNLSNVGAVEHDFSILKKGASAQIPFDHEKQAADILFEARLGANKMETYHFTLPEAGEYQVICGIQWHMEAGMVARITAK